MFAVDRQNKSQLTPQHRRQRSLVAQIAVASSATILLSLTACAVNSAALVANDARMQPSHAPANPAQWKALESQATTFLGADEAAVAPTRLNELGTFAKSELPLTENTCYELVLTWGFPLPAYVSVMFQPGADGTPPNDHVAGRREKFAKSGQTIHYCADHDGTALLNVSALDATTGAVRPKERLEYVFAVKQSKETAAETAARRDQDAGNAKASQAIIDANIAKAKAEEERNRKRNARQCSACQAAYLTCIGNGGSSSSCNRTWTKCRGSLDSFLAGPCAKP